MQQGTDLQWVLSRNLGQVRLRLDLVYYLVATQQVLRLGLVLVYYLVGTLQVLRLGQIWFSTQWVLSKYLGQVRFGLVLSGYLVGTQVRFSFRLLFSRYLVRLGQVQVKFGLLLSGDLVGTQVRLDLVKNSVGTQQVLRLGQVQFWFTTQWVLSRYLGQVQVRFG